MRGRNVFRSVVYGMVREGFIICIWQDGLKKNDSQPETDKVKRLIGIELSEEEFELLEDKDNEAIAKKSCPRRSRGRVMLMERHILKTW